MRNSHLMSISEPVGEGPDLTSLLDVLMILLCSTLVFTTFQVHTWVEGSLQDGQGQEMSSTDIEQVMIAFDGRGRITWNDIPIKTVEDLGQHVSDQDSSRPTRYLMAGDRGAPYGLSLRIKEVLHRAGVEEVRELMQQKQGG